MESVSFRDEEPQLWCSFKMLHRYFWSVNLNLNPISGIIKLYKRFMKQLQKSILGSAQYGNFWTLPKKCSLGIYNQQEAKQSGPTCWYPSWATSCPLPGRRWIHGKRPRKPAAEFFKDYEPPSSGKIDVSWVTWHFAGGGGYEGIIGSMWLSSFGSFF